MAFVRLNEAVLLESVLEVPVPVRFLFVLLGPSQSNMDYHEIGRSISTLMSDKVVTLFKLFRVERERLLFFFSHYYHLVSCLFEHHFTSGEVIYATLVNAVKKYSLFQGSPNLVLESKSSPDFLSSLVID